MWSARGSSMRQPVYRDLNRYTILELRELLKHLKLRVSGTKWELIDRLNAVDSTKLAAALLNSMRSPVSVNIQTNINLNVTTTEATTGSFNRSPRTARRYNIIKHDTESDRSLAQKQMELLNLIPGLFTLLSEFDGERGNFHEWKNQAQVLRERYHLDDESTRVMFSVRLKGKALCWFQSRTEYTRMSVSDLYDALENTFEPRTSKVKLTRTFDRRKWRPNETFCNYYYDKLRLAEGIGIAEQEFIEAVIDGIPDPTLRNRACSRSFAKKEDLLRDFKEASPCSSLYNEPTSSGSWRPYRRERKIVKHPPGTSRRAEMRRNLAHLHELIDQLCPNP